VALSPATQNRDISVQHMQTTILCGEVIYLWHFLSFYLFTLF